MESCKKVAFYLFCYLVYMRTELLAEAQDSSNVVPINIGVVLDLESWVGKLGWSCINMALSDFYASYPDYRTRLVLNLREPQGDVVGAAAAALDLITNVEAQAIIGPTNSMQANFMIDLGNKSRVPIISFSATSPLSSIKSPYFFQATKNDKSQVKAISSIIQAFGWKEAVLVYVDNKFGEGMIPYLTDALQQVNAKVPYRSVISESVSDDQIVSELYKLMTMSTRVFILHMEPSLGSRLFAKAKAIGMMGEGYVWIITDGMTNLWSEIDQSDIDSMQGVLGFKSYVPRSRYLKDFTIRWKKKFHQDHPEIIDAGLDLFGVRAYDAAIALAMAIEKVGTTTFSFHSSNFSNAATDLETLGISQNGPKLVQALANTKFQGLGGEFNLVDGQLQSLAYQIININGKGDREIGFWTPKDGLLRNLDSTNKSLYSTSKDNLRPIIWPGDSSFIPKGWEIPTNGKKLRILVPIQFPFVLVSHDISNNRTIVEGFSIDVFQAAIEEMPYAVPYDFIPFENAHGEMAGTYNDMIYQVFLGNYDAVVGDATIEANRSRFVDFTLPYTESGLTMVVPIRDKKFRNAWVFLKPLTWELWVTTACFFVFVGFVVWVLEHRKNDDFRGPPSYQVGTSLWFAFSTMFFAHREQLVSNLARIVVIIWCFLVLILTQSYTASLTSLLTVQQLQPTVTDVKELIKNGANVAVPYGSYVDGILKGLKFDPLKFRMYHSMHELDEMLSNGTVSAAFSEIPTAKAFLAENCNKYTTVELPVKTSGYGFVFPKGSPLVPDISTAILNVIRSDKIKEIEDAWFKKDTSCVDSSSLVSSNSLGLESFWGLFLIVGAAIASVLLMFMATFFLEHRHVFLQSNSRTSVWTRICSLAQIFHQKDLHSQVFTKTELKEKSESSGMHSPGAVEPSPNPSAYSQHKDFSFVLAEDQGRPSSKFCHPI